MRPARPAHLQSKVGIASRICSRHRNRQVQKSRQRRPGPSLSRVRCRSRVPCPDQQRGREHEPENVKKLIGKDATLANIRAALEDWLPSVAQEQDRVIVVVSPATDWWAQVSADPAPYETLTLPSSRQVRIRWSRANSFPNKVKAKWKVLLTDACHSAKITAESTQQAVYAAVNKLPTKFLTLNSSREQESSYEDPALASGFGVFSYFLIQGWNGNADVNPRDGLVNGR